MSQEIGLNFIDKSSIGGDDVVELCKGEVELNSISNSDEVGDVLGIATIVVIFLAKEERGIVVVSGQDIAASLFEGKQFISDIGTIDASSG